ncbi:MAG: hypothetical protein F6K63_35460 [Moorea sp. SIO1G6]|uniref:hypothetical protein n=1 Tax=unclassified Moorena TaxID=2683338 RepID=UPI0013BA1E6E|nr:MULTISPECIES: hypothetical protein [unclassified Moorena]NEQ10735.1 hypothetical protein [Moorena sp. SIO4E2]NEQ14442.1 hypothetical protein [Moorena sp. SIO3E2]NES86551.1 hypothetical protein [Moorena sp. SIO2B7]NET69397.1 hypothetical protein [Moorena sp. SIO1G6]
MFDNSKRGNNTSWKPKHATMWLLSSSLRNPLPNVFGGIGGVENKVHYVRDVTQEEDASRIRMHQLPQIFAVARNFALNIYRSNGFSNMAQAQRYCQFGLDTLKRIFRMK